MTDQLSIAEYQALATKRPQPKALTNFKQFLEQGGFGDLRCEFQFHPTRKWRFDWAFPDRKVAWEYEGFIGATSKRATVEELVQKAHATSGSILNDIEKYNAALELGWAVYRVHAKSVHDGSAYSLARRVLEGSE